jgi:protocatechuate 3,4-dioxygenase beta subunit
MKPVSLYQSIVLLGAILVASGLSFRTGFLGLGGFMSRRRLLKLTVVGATSLLTGAWRSRSSTRAALGASLSPAASCILTPEQTEGPYYIAREKVRSDIRERRPGIPLKLRLMVVDAATCKPIQGAAVDIWHCDAGGIYSGFVAASTGAGPGFGGGPTDKNTFLRGIQFTDARGVAQFQTIYPGWYRGRTVHIHVKVHLNHDALGHVVHTGQLYFQDSLTARVYRSPRYRARAAARDTFNSTDGIFASGGRQSMLTVQADGHGGYLGSITLGVRRS